VTKVAIVVEVAVIKVAAVPVTMIEVVMVPVTMIEVVMEADIAVTPSVEAIAVVETGATVDDWGRRSIVARSTELDAEDNALRLRCWYCGEDCAGESRSCEQFDGVRLEHCGYASQLHTLASYVAFDSPHIEVNAGFGSVLRATFA
jgi:hypothetical protein